MNRKSLITTGLVIGSFIGGYIPALWGDGGFSFSGIIFSTLGALAGIWAGFKLAEYIS